MLSNVYYGHWELWELFEKVTFDGANKLVIINPNVTVLDVEQHLYSAWKRWVKVEQNTKFSEAFRTVAGDPVGDSQLGRAFFITNGWKIRPPSQNITIQLTGTLFVDESGIYGDDPFVPAVGTYATGIRTTLTDVLLVDDKSAVGGASAQIIAAQVWADAPDIAGLSAQEVWSHALEAGYSSEQIMRLITSVLLGLVSGAETTTMRFRDLLDTKDRVISNVDGNGNRLGHTLDPN